MLISTQKLNKRIAIQRTIYSSNTIYNNRIIDYPLNKNEILAQVEPSSWTLIFNTKDFF